MHGRGRVCLGQEQDLRLPAHPERLSAEPFRRLRRRAPEDPEPRSVDRLESPLVAVVHQVVLAVAEEREVVVGQPLEERLGLGDDGGIHGRRRLAVELLDQRARARPHLLPVLDGGAHVGQDPLDRLAQALELSPIVLARHLDVHDRFADRVVSGGVVVEQLDYVTGGVAPHPHNRVDDQVDPVSEPHQLHRHRVDDERHVVRDDLDQRVRRLPSMLLEVRVVHAHLGLTRSPLLRQVPMRDGRPIEVERVAIRQILGGNPLVVLADEQLARRHLVGGQPFPHAFAHRVDQLGLEIRPLYRHSRPPLFLRSLVVLFASTPTPRVVTGGSWQGRRTEGVPLARRCPRTPQTSGGCSNVVVFAKRAA